MIKNDKISKMSKKWAKLKMKLTFNKIITTIEVSVDNFQNQGRFGLAQTIKF